MIPVLLQVSIVVNIIVIVAVNIFLAADTVNWKVYPAQALQYIYTVLLFTIFPSYHIFTIYRYCPLDSLSNTINTIYLQYIVLLKISNIQVLYFPHCRYSPLYILSSPIITIYCHILDPDTQSNLVNQINEEIISTYTFAHIQMYRLAQNMISTTIFYKT